MTISDASTPIRIRSGPGTNYDVIGALQKDQRVVVRGTDGQGWVLGDVIGSDGQVLREKVWITGNEQWVTITCGLENIDLVSTAGIPPTPTPTPEVTSTIEVELPSRKSGKTEFRGRPINLCPYAGHLGDHYVDGKPTGLQDLHSHVVARGTNHIAVHLNDGTVDQFSVRDVFIIERGTFDKILTNLLDIEVGDCVVIDNAYSNGLKNQGPFDIYRSE